MAFICLYFFLNIVFAVVCCLFLVFLQGLFFMVFFKFFIVDFWFLGFFFDFFFYNIGLNIKLLLYPGEEKNPQKTMKE